MASTVDSCPAPSSLSLSPKVELDACSDNKDDENKNLLSYSGNPKVSRMSYFEVAEKRAVLGTGQNLPIASRELDYTIKGPTTPKATKPRYAFTFVPESPIAVSPSDAVSVASSPGTGSEVWDSPETPSLSPVRRSRVEVLTPLTPYLMDQTIKAEPPSPTASKLDLAASARGTIILDQLAVRPKDSDDDEASNDEPVCREDTFDIPMKLIRGVTTKMADIEAQNMVGFEENYKRTPEIEFCSSSTNVTPSRQRSARTKRSDLKKDGRNNAANVEDSSKASNGKKTSQTKKVSKKTSSGLEYVLPEDIRERLQTSPFQCVASRLEAPYERCNQKAKNPCENVGEMFKKIETCDTTMNGAAILQPLQELLMTFMCGTHRNCVNTRIGGSKYPPYDLNQTSEDNLSYLDTWLKSMSHPGLPSGTSKDQVDGSQAKTEPVSEISSITVSVAVPLSAQSTVVTPVTIRLSKLSPFLPYQVRWSQRQSSLEKLQRKIWKPFKKCQKGDGSGYIYIFWETGEFGKVKIGRTDDLDRRLAEWRRSCKRNFTYHAVTKDDQSTKIPHVSLIETLIHIELNQYRRTRQCHECDRKHQEWFDVQEAHVAKVYKKWRDWILREDPYHFDLGMWRIRPEKEDTVSKVCELIKKEENLSIPHVKKNKKTKSRPRANRRRTV